MIQTDHPISSRWSNLAIVSKKRDHTELSSSGWSQGKMGEKQKER